MRQLLTVLICILISILKSENCAASHGVGAELTYTCQGGNNYRFNFTFYRDCSGIAADTFYNVTGRSTCGAFVYFDVLLDSMKEITNTCPTAVTNCTSLNSNNTGIQAYYYHGDFTIPSACNYWTFGVDPICNRSPAITNLISPGSWCLYAKATLNNDSLQCNNSPVFNSVPFYYFCANQIHFFNLHAYDSDGDSLTYQLIDPHSDEQIDVMYINPITATQPVTYNFPDSTRYDPHTGDMRIIPDNPQITVIAMQVNEYRNGILIGSVERDVELIFQNCANYIPALSEINGGLNNSIHVCAGSMVNFFVRTSDIDVSDTTYLSWDAGIPGGVFTTSGTRRDTGYFSWQTSVQDYRLDPYYFSATVKDNSCPYVGWSTHLYKVYVDSCAGTSIQKNEEDFISANAYYSAVDRKIFIEYKLNAPAAAGFTLYDIAGRRLKIVYLSDRSEYSGSIDVTAFSGGLYFLNLTTESGFVKTFKVIID